MGKSKLKLTDALTGQEKEIEYSDVEVTKVVVNEKGGVDIDFSVDGFSRVVRGMDPVNYTVLIAGMMKAWLADEQAAKETGVAPQGLGETGGRDHTRLGAYLRVKAEQEPGAAIPAHTLVEWIYGLMSLSKATDGAAQLLHLLAANQGDRIRPSAELLVEMNEMEMAHAEDMPSEGL